MMALKSCFDTCPPPNPNIETRSSAWKGEWVVDASDDLQERGLYLVSDCACGQEAVFLEEHRGATGKQRAMLLVLSTPPWFSFSLHLFYPLSISIALFFLLPINLHSLVAQIGGGRGACGAAVALVVEDE
jgi:hypothetical protein